MKKLTLLVMFLMLMIFGSPLVYADQYQWRGLYEGAQHKFREGLPGQSMTMAKESLKKADVEYGADSLYALKSLTLLGDLHSASGSYSESARYYRRAFEVQKKLFGSLHPNTAKVLNSLAVVEFNDGRVPEAMAKFSKSIEIADLSGHGSDPCMAESLIGMSEALKAAGNYEESERNLLAALDVLDNYSKYNPKLNLTIANARISLAENLKAQARYREANAQYRAAIRYFETRGVSSLKTMTDSLIAMGDCYISSNKKARALDCYKRALASANGNLGGDMTVALISRRLAGVYKACGNIPEARRYYRMAVTSLETCSPSGCPLLADTQKSLTDLGEKSGKFGPDNPA